MRRIRSQQGYWRAVTAVLALLLLIMAVLIRIFWRLSPEEQAVKAREWYQRAHQALRGGSAEEALHLYEKIASRAPDSNLAPEALYKVGYIRTNFQGDDRGAIRAYEKLREKYPDTQWAREALYGLAVNMDRTQQWESLLEKNQALLRERLPHLDADLIHLSSMKALWYLGRHPEAYQEALRVRNKNARHIRMNLIYHQLMVKFNPEDIQAMQRMAEAYRLNGFEDRAQYWQNLAAAKKRLQDRKPSRRAGTAGGRRAANP